MARIVLEGTWTGYVSRQSRIVHREIINNKRAERLRKLHKIVYTDGTALLINVRETELREKIVPIHSYNDLIRDAENNGGNVVLVTDLLKKVSA